MCSNLAEETTMHQHPPVLSIAGCYPPDHITGRGRLPKLIRLPQESWCLLRTALLRPLVSLGEVCLVQEGDVPMGAAFVSFWRMCTGIRTRIPWAQCGAFPRSPQLLCSVHRVGFYASAVGRVRVEQLWRLPLDVVDQLTSRAPS